MDADKANSYSPSFLEQDKSFQEFSMIQKEFNLFMDRLNKLESQRGKFRDSVLDKVRSDYLKKLDELKSTMIPLISRMKEVIQLIDDQKQKLMSERDMFQEQMEELELRFLLGEFQSKQYDTKRKEFETVIRKTQDEVNNLSEQLQMIQSLLPTPTETTSELITSEKDAEPQIDFPTNSEQEEPEESSDNLPYDNEEVDEVQDLPGKEAVYSQLEESELEEDAEYGAHINDDQFLAATTEAVTEEDEFISGLDSTDHLGLPNRGSSKPDYNAYLATDTPEELDEPPVEIEDEEASDIDSFHDMLLDEEAEEKSTVIPIVEVIEGEYKGESFPVTSNLMKIGRGPDNDIQLAVDTSVSRHHSQLVYQGNKYMVIDLNSSNGTFVNGVRVKEKALKDQDLLMIGQTKMIFHLPIKS